jgi:hypothetical protein
MKKTLNKYTFLRKSKKSHPKIKNKKIFFLSKNNQKSRRRRKRKSQFIPPRLRMYGGGGEAAVESGFINSFASAWNGGNIPQNSFYPLNTHNSGDPTSPSMIGASRLDEQVPTTHPTI